MMHMMLARPYFVKMSTWKGGISENKLYSCFAMKDTGQGVMQQMLI